MQRTVSSDRRRPSLDGVASSEPSDEALLESVRADPPHGFEALVRHHHGRLFRVVLAITGNDADAEDAVQHTFARAYEHRDQFAGQSTFSTWLRRIAVHEALLRVRRTRKQRELEHYGPDAGWRNGGEHLATPEHQAFRSELRGLIAAAFRRLSEPHRTVLVLRELEGLTGVEVAERLGLSEALVRVRLHRARARLREVLPRESR